MDTSVVMDKNKNIPYDGLVLLLVSVTWVAIIACKLWFLQMLRPSSKVKGTLLPMDRLYMPFTLKVSSAGSFTLRSEALFYMEAYVNGRLAGSIASGPGEYSLDLCLEAGGRSSVLLATFERSPLVGLAVLSVARPGSPLEQRFVLLRDGRVLFLKSLFRADCVVCLSRPADLALLPCRHACLCHSCYQRLSNLCPICRANIISYFQL